MDKREAVRVPVRVRAQCRCSGVVIDGLVEDLSRSGLFMRAPDTIGLGSSAELDLELPNHETLHFAATVVRVERDANRVGMGFRFLDEAEPKRSLANFIMRQHQNTTR